MKSAVLKYLISAVFLFTNIVVFAEGLDSSSHQIGVGVENNRLLFGQYTWNDCLTARLNVSVYSEKLAFQYVRATVGYTKKLNVLTLSGKCFYGSAFNGSYYNAGAFISADAKLAKRLLIDATVAPWYDSGYHYNTCWQGRVGCILTKHIDIKVGYTTIPEYRMSEKRVIGGFDFHVKQLSVSPYLSVGTESRNGGKNVRMIIGFEYQF